MQKELKELLGEELVNQIAEKVDIEKIKSVDKGEYVPRDVMNKEVEKHKSTLQAQVDELTKQLEDRAKDLTELEKKAKAGEDAAAQITEMTKKYEEQDTKTKATMEKIKKEADAKIALIDAKAPKHLIKAMLMELDFDKVQDVNGKWVGLDEQIQALKESEFKNDFGRTYVSGDAPAPGSEPDQNKVKNPFVKGENFSLFEQSKLKKEDPKLWNKFRADVGLTP